MLVPTLSNALKSSKLIPFNEKGNRLFRIDTLTCRALRSARRRVRSAFSPLTSSRAASSLRCLASQSRNSSLMAASCACLRTLSSSWSSSRCDLVTTSAKSDLMVVRYSDSDWSRVCSSSCIAFSHTASTSCWWDVISCCIILWFCSWARFSWRVARRSVCWGIKENEMRRS